MTGVQTCALPISAMTSDDPRVVETLRKLIMIVTLTAPETRKEHNRQTGPLRRLFEDMSHLTNRMHRMEEDLNKVARDQQRAWPRREEYRWEDQERYAKVAAAQMAQSIDNDVLKKIASVNYTQPKGLYDK